MKLPRLWGTVLVVLGLLFNKFLLEATVIPDHEIDSLLLNTLIIALQLLLLSSGVFIFVKGRSPIRLSMANAGVLLFSLVFTFLMAELAARFWLSHIAVDKHLAIYGTFDQISRSRTLTFSPHHYLKFIPRPDYAEGDNLHNALGFRGQEVVVPKPPGVYRIVLLGGSTTYTYSVEDYRHSYPYLLQEILREKGHASVEVVNAGVPKYTTWESLINLAFRCLELEPDMVILYHGVNEVHTRLVFPFEAYQSDNSGSREVFSFQESILDHSTLLRILRTRLGLRKRAEGFFSAYEGVLTNVTEEFRRQKTSETYPSGLFAQYPASQILEKNKPVYFERNLRSMIAICREFRIKAVLMTFASSKQFSPIEPTSSSAEYQSAYEEQNKMVLGLSETYGVPCFDFAGQMPPDKKYWEDGRHVNKEGARLKAEMVADFLIDHHLVPDRHPQ